MSLPDPFAPLESVGSDLTSGFGGLFSTPTVESTTSAVVLASPVQASSTTQETSHTTTHSRTTVLSPLTTSESSVRKTTSSATQSVSSTTAVTSEATTSETSTAASSSTFTTSISSSSAASSSPTAISRPTASATPSLPETQSSGPNVTPVGYAVGGFLGLAVVATMLFLLYKRYGQKWRKDRFGSKEPSDDNDAEKGVSALRGFLPVLPRKDSKFNSQSRARELDDNESVDGVYAEKAKANDEAGIRVSKSFQRFSFTFQELGDRLMGSSSHNQSNDRPKTPVTPGSIHEATAMPLKREPSKRIGVPANGQRALPSPHEKAAPQVGVTVMSPLSANPPSPRPNPLSSNPTAQRPRSRTVPSKSDSEQHQLLSPALPSPASNQPDNTPRRSRSLRQETTIVSPLGFTTHLQPPPESKIKRKQVPAPTVTSPASYTWTVESRN